ncbi:hypothetical protein [Rhizohabitans arisaemae]|uniref:hypothetical protein n=1 Tax=Rhizohabitans arisaemae TaxID=2720610 RepID=UPI0024B1655C|nr:hypothetical protein [Rhizohabitans arisaemae]
MNAYPIWSIVGLTYGTVLGLAGAFGGLGAFLLVLVLGVAGLFVGRVAEAGNLDMSDLFARRR